MKKTTVFKIMVVTVCLIFVVVLFRNCIPQQTSKSVNELQQTTNVILSENLLQKEYEQNLEKVRNFERVINSDIEIIALEVTDSYTVFHERGEDSVLDLLFGSSITLDVLYTVILSIPTSAIDINYDKNASENKFNISYDSSKIAIKSIQIDNLQTFDEYGIFAKKYLPEEMAVLTLVATDMIQEEIGQDEMLYLLAKQNIEGYLRIQAYVLHVFDISISEMFNLE